MGEQQFGRFRLVQQIAVGGMAAIYLARTCGSAGFEKYVALKMLHPNFSQDEQFVEMLIDEAKISVQLQHANIAQTFDLGRVDQTYYITMEYVDGADLYKILRRAAERGMPMPVDVAAFIAKEMANGLDYAHRRRALSGQALGIVHRDVSPQNVLISHAGEVKLVDFGIAKATMKARQTAVGVIKGKYYYMSPEQAWGDRVDHRTDIFSTGVCLYEALTGHMLYQEEELQQLLQQVRRAEIQSPTTRRRDIPPQIERIVMRSLARERDERYQNAGDMATDLERFLHVYSPVFTASKLADFFRGVLVEEEPPTTKRPAVSKRTPAPEVPMHTMRLEPDQILSDSAELSDENSIIFDMNRLGSNHDANSDPTLAPIPMSPTAAHTLAGVAVHNAHGVEDVESIEALAMILSPPDFGGANLGDFEPTLVGTGGGFDIADTYGEPAPLQNDKAELPRQLHEAKRMPDTNPTSPPQQPARAGAGGKRVPDKPVLAASTPKPAVSLTGPKRSRTTAAECTPPTEPSLLAGLVPTDGLAPVRREAQKEEAQKEEAHKQVRGPSKDAHAHTRDSTPACGLTRYTDISFPTQVALGAPRVSLVLRLLVSQPELSVACEEIQVCAGTVVTTRLVAPAFELLGESVQHVRIEHDRDSQPLVFDLRPLHVGDTHVTLELYQGGSPVGTISVAVQVTTGPVSACDSIRPGPVLHLTAEATAPDLVVVVAYEHTEHRHALVYTLFRTTDGAFREFTPVPLQSNPRTTMARYYEHLVVLAKLQDPVAKAILGEQVRLAHSDVDHRVRQLGHTLWRELLPEDFQQLYAREREHWKDKTLLIISDEPWIPWELIWPYSVGEPGEDQSWRDEEPWCLRFGFTRWLRRDTRQQGLGGAPTHLRCGTLACVAPTDAGLPAAQHERDYVRLWLTEQGVKDLSPSAASWRTVMTLLADKNLHWLHVAAHGTFRSETPGADSAVWLQEGVTLTPDQIVGPDIEPNLRCNRTAFVFNACHAARQDMALTCMGGWAQQLIGQGAGLFLGPLWTVSDDRALAFAKALYTALGKGCTVAEAVRAARRDARAEGDPTWLAYSIYAHPNARLYVEASREPPPLAHARQMTCYSTTHLLGAPSDAHFCTAPGKRHGDDLSRHTRIAGSSYLPPNVPLPVLMWLSLLVLTFSLGEELVGHLTLFCPIAGWLLMRMQRAAKRIRARAIK